MNILEATWIPTARASLTLADRAAMRGKFRGPRGDPRVLELLDMLERTERELTRATRQVEEMQTRLGRHLS